MSEAIYLDLDDLMAAAEPALGRRPEVRDYGLLESALARPQASVFGEDAYPSIHQKAAALLHSLVTNHALVDGNKRLGTFAMLLFYAMNDYGVAASDDELFDLVIAIADQRMAEVDKIADMLGLWTVHQL